MKNVRCSEGFNSVRLIEKGGEIVGAVSWRALGCMHTLPESVVPQTGVNHPIAAFRGVAPIRNRAPCPKTKTRQGCPGRVLRGRDAYSFFGDHNDLDLAFFTSVCSCSVTAVSPMVLIGPVGICTIDLVTYSPGRGKRFSYVNVGDRAEQAAVDAGLLCHLELNAIEFFAQCGLSASFRRQPFRGRHDGQRGQQCSSPVARFGLALRDQEVAGVAVLDFNDVAEQADVQNFFQEG